MRRATKIQHVLSARQFKDRGLLAHLFGLADDFKTQGAAAALSGKTMATLFYEPSTRTRLSFEAAMQRLGGHVLSSENMVSSSSASKGESLEDTVRVVGSYADVIVLRHPAVGAAERASAVSSMPIINAGDGSGEHPTQALLDLYTLLRHLGTLEGKTIALAGDLRHGRTVHSLVQLLALYPGVQIVLISTDDIKLPRRYLSGVSGWHEVRRVKDFDHLLDALYVTRLQAERWGKASRSGRLREQYVVNEQWLSCLKQTGVILHPLPRAGELVPAVDADPRAVYFEQAQNGLYVRMALLYWLLLSRAES